MGLESGHHHSQDHKCDTASLQKIQRYKVKYLLEGSNGPANLPLDNYAHGPTAPYNSWCLLGKEGGEE